MTLAARIKKRMSDLQLTQEAVANRAELSQGMVFKLVSGKSKSTSKIVQLAHALECDVEWLASGKTAAQSAAVRETDSTYRQSLSPSIGELSKQIRALPLSDQKQLVIEIVEELFRK